MSRDSLGSLRRSAPSGDRRPRKGSESVTKLTHFTPKIGDFASSGDQRLYATFLDNRGARYEWTPLWGDITQLIESAASVENINGKPHDWLQEWARLTQAIARSACGAVRNAERVEGRLERVDEGRIVVAQYRYDPDERCFYTGEKLRWSGSVAFPLTEAWVREFVGENVRVLVINDLVVEVTKIPLPSDEGAAHGR